MKKHHIFFITTVFCCSIISTAHASREQKEEGASAGPQNSSAPLLHEAGLGVPTSLVNSGVERSHDSLPPPQERMLDAPTPAVVTLSEEQKDTIVRRENCARCFTFWKNRVGECEESDGLTATVFMLSPAWLIPVKAALNLVKSGLNGMAVLCNESAAAVRSMGLQPAPLPQPFISGSLEADVVVSATATPSISAVSSSRLVVEKIS